MRAETPNNLPARPDDPHVPVEATEEQAVGACAHARHFVALKVLPRFFVGQGYLADLEEIE